jgi:hypothetical protein
MAGLVELLTITTVQKTKSAAGIAETAIWCGTMSSRPRVRFQPNRYYTKEIFAYFGCSRGEARHKRETCQRVCPTKATVPSPNCSRLRRSCCQIGASSADLWSRKVPIRLGEAILGYRTCQPRWLRRSVVTEAVRDGSGNVKTGVSPVNLDTSVCNAGHRYLPKWVDGRSAATHRLTPVCVCSRATAEALPDGLFHPVVDVLENAVLLGFGQGVEGLFRIVSGLEPR